LAEIFQATTDPQYIGSARTIQKTQPLYCGVKLLSRRKLQEYQQNTAAVLLAAYMLQALLSKGFTRHNIFMIWNCSTMTASFNASNLE
jgi:hypothetical protein